MSQPLPGSGRDVLNICRANAQNGYSLPRFEKPLPLPRHRHARFTPQLGLHLAHQRVDIECARQGYTPNAYFSPTMKATPTNTQTAIMIPGSRFTSGIKSDAAT